MVTIGTMVIANDGFTQKLGQVADHKTTEWGTFHVVLIEGKFREAGTISPADENDRRIGWKVATLAEVERLKRYAA